VGCLFFFFFPPPPPPPTHTPPPPPHPSPLSHCDSYFFFPPSLCLHSLLCLCVIFRPTSRCNSLLFLFLVFCPPHISSPIASLVAFIQLSTLLRHIAVEIPHLPVLQTVCSFSRTCFLPFSITYAFFRVSFLRFPRHYLLPARSRSIALLQSLFSAPQRAQSLLNSCCSFPFSSKSILRPPLASCPLRRPGLFLSRLRIASSLYFLYFSLVAAIVNQMFAPHPPTKNALS